MALREPHLEKIVANASTLELKPDVGAGLLVTNIEVKTTAASDFATVKIGKATVGYFRVAPAARNHLALHRNGVRNFSLLKQLKALGLEVTYPVAEGQTFQITLSNNAEWIKVTYQEHDAGDIRPDMPNGSDAQEYFFVNYGTNKDAVAATGYVTLDKSRNPVEFPDFPFGQTVPARRQVHLLGIMAAELEKNTYTGAVDTYSRTRRLRVIRERTTLFDEDKNGFIMQGDGAAAGAANSAYLGGVCTLPWGGEDQDGELFLLPEPLVFTAGEEVQFQVDVQVEAGAGLAADDLEVALLLRVTAAS